MLTLLKLCIATAKTAGRTDPPPNSRVVQGGGQEREDVQLRKAWNRLLSLARDEGAARCERMLRDKKTFLCSEMRISERDFERDIRDPASALERWQELTQKACETRRERGYQAWRRKLFTWHGQPSVALYRWLRGVQQGGHFVCTYLGTVHRGPKAFFEAVRQYWGTIMRRNQQDYTQALDYLEDLASRQEWEESWGESSQHRDVLGEVQKRIRTMSSSGMDGWPPSALRLMPVESFPAILEVFQTCCQLQRWPTPWQCIRTHLVPKNAEVCPAAEAFRPLSLLSAWYRWWSSWALRSFDNAFWQSYDTNLRGGIVGRDIGNMIISTMMDVEERNLEPGTASDIYILSLDATKCFDLVRIEDALRAMIAKGVPDWCVLGLGALWTRCERVFSVYGRLDGGSLRGLNGIPQGCALSVMACNALVEGWLGKIQAVGAQGKAYIDDRYIIARDPYVFDSGAREGFQWEQDHGWQTNLKKSSVASIPRIQAQEQVGGVHIQRTDTLTSLGTELPMQGRAKTELPAKRHAKAIDALTRIATLRLPLHIAQQLIESIVIPKTCFHVQARPLQDIWCERLRRAINVATRMRHRGHCTDIVAALFRRPHRYDPKSAAMYNHIVAVLRVLRTDPVMREQWRRLTCMQQPSRPRGPVGVWQKYMNQLGIDEEDGKWTHHPTGETCAWKTSDSGKVTHFLRAMLRHRLLERAALKRVHLRGAGATDVETTVKSIRSRNAGHQGELRMLMADGVWTQRRRAAAGWVPDAICPSCDNREEETLQHLLHECPAWERLRRWSGNLKAELATMSNAGRLCGLCPKEASREVQSEWERVPTSVC